MSIDVYRLWMTVLIFGTFHRIQIWRGEPVEFVLGEVPPWALLEFEKLEGHGKGWVKIAIPEWAYEQVYNKTIKEQLK